MNLKKWAGTYVVVMEVYTEKDLPELLRLLHYVRAKWESIATQLGLSQGDIEAIARKKFHDPDDCLKEVIKLWLTGVDPVPTREQLARVLQSPPVGREGIAQQVVPGLSKLKSPQKLDPPVPAREQPVRVPPIGKENIAQKVVLGLLKLPKNLDFWLVCLCSILLALVIIYPSPGKSLSLPVLKQELIGREEEMKVIMGYFIESEVEGVTLYGQAGFGKSEIALHVGHRMLQLGLDVHYIRVENFEDVSSLEKELMDISDTFYTSKRLVKWAKGLTKKTLLILDNVDGQHWVSDTSRRQLKESFLYPLLDNTFHLQVLITSQQDIMTTHVYLSYRLYSLSTDDCVHLMVYHSRNAESDTGDLGIICDLVGNVPFASKVLAKTLSSGISAKHIIQTLNEKSKLKIIADKADEVGKDRLLNAIELAFQFVKPTCQISIFILIKFWSPFTLEEVSRYITADMMSNYLTYTDFDLYECLFELSAKSFLEIRQYYFSEGFTWDLQYYQDVEAAKHYHFHELIVDYLKNSNIELTELEILQAYWKNRLNSGIVARHPWPNDKDYVALTQIVDQDDSFSFDASIALIINFPCGLQILKPAVLFLVSRCEMQGYSYTRLSTYDIIQGYIKLLKYVICQDIFTTEWNCMDVISLCLPIIDKFIDLSVHLFVDIDFSRLIMRKYLETGNICDSIWKHSLHVYALFGTFTPLHNISRGLEFYSDSDYDKAIHSLHEALEDTSSPYDFMIYMTLYIIYSKQDNLTGMEESLAGIHKLDFQQINITCYTYSARYEDPHVTTAILFLQQVNETKLADKLRSKLFVATYAKMGCCDLKPHLLNSLYHYRFR